MPDDAEHVHDWHIEEFGQGARLVIATNPPLHPYVCDCGAFTHHPDTGEPCWCHPEDYERRKDTWRPVEPV